eukprot:5855650-Pyramimonas_sp.AAC.1
MSPLPPLPHTSRTFSWSCSRMHSTLPRCSRRVGLDTVSQSREERRNILGAQANHVRRDGIYSERRPIT